MRRSVAFGVSMHIKHGRLRDRGTAAEDVERLVTGGSQKPATLDPVRHGPLFGWIPALHTSLIAQVQF